MPLGELVDWHFEMAERMAPVDDYVRDADEHLDGYGAWPTDGYRP